MIKDQRGQTVQRRISYRLNSCRPRESFQNAHFAKKIARCEFCKLDFVRLPKMLADFHHTFADDEESVSSFSFPNDDFARSGFDFFSAFPEQVQGGFIEASEDWHVL